jgi:hypothetical protein
MPSKCVQELFCNLIPNPLKRYGLIYYYGALREAAFAYSSYWRDNRTDPTRFSAAATRQDSKKLPPHSLGKDHAAPADSILNSRFLTLINPAS